MIALILGLVEAAVGSYSFMIKVSEIRQWLSNLFTEKMPYFVPGTLG